MIRINQIKMPRAHSESELAAAAASKLHIPADHILSLSIRRMSIDARKKPLIYKVYTLDISLKHEERLLRRLNDRDVSFVNDQEYIFPLPGRTQLTERPVVVGAGPAGLFCAYMLASNGYKPILLERGPEITKRLRDVTNFWTTGCLDPESNVQFGEGGAGTFSDGKLNTLTHDKMGRSRKVLETFVSCGAPADILYKSDPHVGTDLLSSVIKNMRNNITAMGGSVRFLSHVTDILIRKGSIIGVEINNSEKLPASAVVFAPGHSARDTFALLYDRSVMMTPKSFAVGVRVEHPQSLINSIQYGEENPADLWPAEYKLAAKTENGRGVYTFCMCPGGYVINASSEPGHLAVNGMSYRARGGSNANSAVVVTVSPDDFLPFGSPGTPDALRGISFQRHLEKQAYIAGNGRIPVQLLGDFRANRISKGFGSIMPCMRGAFSFGDVRGIMPGYLAQSIIEGMNTFDRGLPGFGSNDVIISGIESRTSSPVRVTRNEYFESNIHGLYPCGEGAGYAGGIMSAAIDGIKIAEAIARKYIF